MKANWIIVILVAVVLYLIFLVGKQQIFIYSMSINYDSLTDVHIRNMYQKEGKWPDTIPAFFVYSDTSLYEMKKVKGYEVWNQARRIIHLDSNKVLLPSKYYIFNNWLRK